MSTVRKNETETLTSSHPEKIKKKHDLFASRGRGGEDAPPPPGRVGHHSQIHTEHGAVVGEDGDSAGGDNGEANMRHHP